MNKLILSWPHDGKTGDEYRVEKIQGSICYKPGELLTVAAASDLCQMTGMWQITMIGKPKG